MRAAVIVDGVVDNIIEVDALDVLEGVTLIEAPFASVGDLWDGDQFSSPVVEPAPPVVPEAVTRRQARQALLLAGLLDDVPVKIAAIPDETARRMAQIEWEDSQEFVRSRPLVVQIGGALGLDSDALDALFIHAASL